MALDFMPFSILRMICLMEGTDHMFRYADNEKLGWFLIFCKTDIKPQITVTI